ncbi:MAG TPA: hypothetical protein VNA21_16550, partial [Steroidobacteraceae bacterium]|nr:hypothetical protein [Steroidobacteraceae bacterium]
CVVGLTAIALVARSSMARQALQWMVQHPVIVSLAASIYTLLLVRRLRLRLALEYTRSWLRAAPISSRSFSAMAALRIASNVFMHLTVLSVLVVSVSLVVTQPVASTLLPLLCGVLIGVALGTLLPRPSVSQHSTENSRFLIRGRHVASRPSLDGLSMWPIAHALAWHRPENSRFLFIAAALSVPVGSSALLGLAILATWSLASYLFALARAVPDVAKEAALWLRPTSVPFGSFAWAITRRVLAHQLIAVTLLGGVAVAAGGTILSVLYFCAMWLLISAMIAMINVRQHFLALPPLLRTVIATGLVLAAESRVRGWGAGLAIVISFAHLRGPTRVRT